MKFPKRLSDILARKQAFIDSQRGLMESSVIRLQNKLFSDIIALLISELDIKDGMIVDNAKNYRLISVLDKTYKDFQKTSGQVIFNQINSGTSKVADLSVKYFISVGNLPERFVKIIDKTNKLVNLRLGMEGGKLVRGGFLQSFFEMNTVGLELKNIVSKAVTSNMDKKELINILRDKITGLDKKTGALERQFQRYAYDIYQQYDAAYNLMLGNEFGFTYFIYQGGLINDSRDFCAAHNNKVWSIKESETWAEWTPSQGEYPEGYEVKQHDIYAVPSHLGYPGYDPLIDRGGYNCRHSLGWVNDDLALNMRPELKNIS